jgi:hypothetical protein
MPASQEFHDSTLYLMRAENAVSICAKFISYLQILYPLPDKEDNSMKFAIYFA